MWQVTQGQNLIISNLHVSSYKVSTGWPINSDNLWTRNQNDKRNNIKEKQFITMNAD